jgi:hypothetical protein
MNKLTTAVLGLSLLTASAFAAGPQAADSSKMADQTATSKTKVKKAKKAKKTPATAAPKTEAAPTK